MPDRFRSGHLASSDKRVDALNQRLRELRQIGQRALLDLAALAIALAQQDRRRRHPVRDRIDEHVRLSSMAGGVLFCHLVVPSAVEPGARAPKVPISALVIAILALGEHAPLATPFAVGRLYPRISIYDTGSIAPHLARSCQVDDAAALARQHPTLIRNSANAKATTPIKTPVELNGKVWKLRMAVYLCKYCRSAAVVSRTATIRGSPSSL